MRVVPAGAVLLELLLIWILRLDVCMSALQDLTWDVVQGSGCRGNVTVTCPAGQRVVVKTAQVNTTCLTGSSLCSQHCRPSTTSRRGHLAGICDTNLTCVIPPVPCPPCTIVTARTEYTCVTAGRFYTMCGSRSGIQDVNWGLLYSDMFPALITTSDCYMVLGVPRGWRAVVRPLFLDLHNSARIDVCSSSGKQFRCLPPGDMEHTSDVTIHVTANENNPDSTRFLLEFEMYEYTPTSSSTVTSTKSTSKDISTSTPTTTSPKSSTTSTSISTTRATTTTAATTTTTTTTATTTLAIILRTSTTRGSVVTGTTPETGAPLDNGSSILSSRIASHLNRTSTQTRDLTTSSISPPSSGNTPSTPTTPPTPTPSTTHITTSHNPSAFIPAFLTPTVVPSTTDRIDQNVKTEGTTTKDINGVPVIQNNALGTSDSSSLGRSDYIIIGLVIFLAIIIISFVVIFVVVYRRSNDSALRRVVVVMVREPTKRLSQLSKLFRMSDIDRRARYSNSPEENNSKHSSSHHGNVISLRPVLVESSSQTASALRRLGQLSVATDSFSSDPGGYERPPGPPPRPQRQLRDSEVVVEGAVGGQEEKRGEEGAQKGLIDFTQPSPPPPRKKLTKPPGGAPFPGTRALKRVSSSPDPMYDTVGTLPPPLMPRSRPTTPPPQVQVTPPTPEAGTMDGEDLTFSGKKSERKLQKAPAFDDPPYADVDPLPGTSSGGQGAPHTPSGRRKPSIDYESEDLTIVENESYGEVEFQ